MKKNRKFSLTWTLRPATNGIIVIPGISFYGAGLMRGEIKQAGDQAMVHFTCDLCGRELDRQRFVVKVEAFAATQAGPLTEADLEDSNLEAVAEILRDMEDGLPCTLPPPTRHWRFDLCQDCHARYSRDPLAKGKLALSQK